MDKERIRCRVDNETGEIVRLYSFDMRPVVITGFINPITGIPVSYRLPYISLSGGGANE